MNEKKLTPEQENKLLKAEKEANKIGLALAFGSLSQSAKLTQDLMEQYKAESEKWFEAKSLLRELRSFLVQESKFIPPTNYKLSLIDSIDDLTWDENYDGKRPKPLARYLD